VLIDLIMAQMNVIKGADAFLGHSFVHSELPFDTDKVGVVVEIKLGHLGNVHVIHRSVVAVHSVVDGLVCAELTCHHLHGRWVDDNVM